MDDEWESSNIEDISSSLPIKINKIKEIFRDDILFKIKRPGPFDGARVLKTKGGLIALIIYIFTGWITLSMVVDIGKSVTLNENFFILILVSIFLTPLSEAFAYTSPLEDNLFLALRKYPAYLGYNILILIITMLLIGLMVVLTLIGLCLGLILGLAILFYILYRLFFAPGIIALTNQSTIAAMSESFELTKGWEGIDIFIVYFVVATSISIMDKYLIEMALGGHMEAMIIVFLLNIPIFIIAASITLFVASFKQYLYGAIEVGDQSLSNSLT